MNFFYRLLDEQKELQQRLDGLTAFISNPNFIHINKEQKELLEQQLITMQEYNNILIKRIDLLKLDLDESEGDNNEEYV